MRFNRLGANIAFLLGPPRSGTTWLQKVLACHPDVCTIQETHLFDSFIGPALRTYHNYLTNPSGRGGTGLPACFTIDEMHELMREIFYRAIEQAEGYDSAKLFLEKTPAHALVLDRIYEIFPKTKLIYMVRDPRDVVASLIAAGRSWGRNWAPRDIFSGARVWRRHVVSSERHMKRVPEVQKLTVRYEDFLAASQAELTRILGFLELDIRPEELRRQIEGARQFRIPKYGEFAKITGTYVEDPSDFVRKGKAGSWREDLGTIRGACIVMMLFKEMKWYGYI